VQRTIAESIGLVSDVTLCVGDAGAGSFHGAALDVGIDVEDMDEAGATVPSPHPDTGVGTVCVLAHAAERSKEATRASRTRTCKARNSPFVGLGDRGALRASSQIAVPVAP
jgi:hypothetical protein